MSFPLIRHLLELFRTQKISVEEVAAELEISRRRVYDLLTDYLKAYARGSQSEWTPGSSGGNHTKTWPDGVCELLRRRLSSKPPSSYSFAASEVDRLLAYKLDRAQVRHWAIEHGLAHGKPQVKIRAPTRRWQRQNVGELWQLDATPHAWFKDNPTQFPMLNMLDDCSRLFVGSKLYERETLLAYMDFLPAAFLEYGFPLALYVDYHSLFFTQTPDALTELGRALRFYGTAFRYAPSPQAKGKVEREHQYWQARLPAFFAAEGMGQMPAANESITVLRRHRNLKEDHRELKMTAQSAWDMALAENRTSLRPAVKDAWWPYVWSVKRNRRTGDDGRLLIGNQMVRLEVPPRTRVVLCQHPCGHYSVLASMPDPSKLPVILFTNQAK